MRDVGARDEQDEPDGGEEHDDRLARVADDQVFERRDVDVAVRAGKSRFESRRERRHRRPRLVERDARRQPREDAQAVARCAEVARSPSASGAQSSARVAQNGANLNRWRHDADDRVGPAVERDRAAERVGIAAEDAPPETVRDDHFAGAGVARRAESGPAPA